MSEYQGNYDGDEPSYAFNGPAPKMDENDYFSLSPTPEGMKPIVDPNTRMCIEYDDKYGNIYNFEGKIAYKYISGYLQII